MFMMSSGGLTAAELFQGKDAILSGPAGGVVGMAETGRQAGFDRLIGFDMGGTSTDVSHFDGEYERAFETEVAGVRMRAPMMLIHTVAAGGGSILHYDGARFRVGPDSAGANPGPKCYRRGGPLAVTDANVMLGKLMPDFFPKIFGPAQDQPLDDSAVKAAFADMAKEVGGKSPEEIADGFVKIAVENMANAIKKISVQRGYDVTRYALNCFGGAGGQHACLVADALGMTRVLIHPFSSLLSAYGMGLADIRATREQAIELAFGDKALKAIARIGGKLGKDAIKEVAGQGVPKAKTRLIVRAHIRYAGTDTALVVDAGSLASMQRAFEKAHKGRFGFIDRNKEIGGRGGVGRGDRRRRQVQREDAAALHREAAAAGAQDAVLLARRMAQGQCLHPRPAQARRQGQGRGDRHRAAPDHRRRAGLAGGTDGQEPPRADAHQKAQAHLRHRHPCRSGDAGGVQQPVHVDRRADGRVAAEHRLLRQHQGAARLLLRRLRARRHVGRQRAAHAGASRLDGPLGRDHHPRQQGQDQTGRRLRHQRALQRRHASARHHRVHAGVRHPHPTLPRTRGREREGAHPVLGRLARPSRRRRRHLARLDVAERDQHRAGRRAVRQLQAGRPRPLPREGIDGGAHRREISGAQSDPERQRHQGADRRQREGRGRAAQDGDVVHHAGGQGLHAARAGQRGGKRAPRHRPPARLANTPTRWTRAP